ncbi:MAG: mandelate racemase/muconate lactonizing enzyme family protein [Abditibacteriaceae bacterium]
MKITKIETVCGTPSISGLLLCRIYTDSGLIGSGETYYIPTAVAAIIHDWMAQRLIGADALNTEGHWRFLYERATNFGARGAELRALSAIDLALWDIKGQAAGMPVWQLLGGKSQEGVRIYSSIGYGRDVKPHAIGSWPGYGQMGEKQPLNDYWSAVNEPVTFANELLAEGIGAAKLWTLDFAAHKLNGNIYVSYADIEKALEPFHAIREAVGTKLELILDGHGFFQLPAALRIAEVARDLKLLCLEDIIRPDCVDTIRDFRAQSGMPLAVSEMLISSEDYRLLLEKRATDYVMIDPTWVGGISQTLRITDFAQSYNVPLIMHDCTGPLTLLAGIHVGVARGNVAWQETVRYLLRVSYPEIVDQIPAVEDGRMMPPEAPGIGAKWYDELFENARTLQVSQ